MSTGKRKQPGRGVSVRASLTDASSLGATGGQTGGGSSSGVERRDQTATNEPAESTTPPGADSQETQDELAALKVLCDDYQYAGGPYPWKEQARYLKRREMKEAGGAGGREDGGGGGSASNGSGGEEEDESQDGDGSDSDEGADEPTPSKKRRKVKATTITSSMSPSVLLKHVVSVVGKDGEAALWGMLTKRSPPTVLAAMSAGQGGRRSSKVASVGEVSSLRAHAESRSQVCWMNLPFTAGWLGDGHTKFNIEGASMSTVENNAFCMTGFLQCTPLEGQSRKDFLSGFRTTQTNTKAAFHKIVRSATHTFVTALTSAAVRGIKRDVESNEIEADDVPSDASGLIDYMRSRIDSLDTTNGDFKTWRAECFKSVLDAHQSPSYPTVTWGHILGTGDITKFQTSKFFLGVFKYVIRSALSDIEGADAEADVNRTKSGTEDDVDVAGRVVISQSKAWSILKKGGAAKKTFQNELFGCLLRTWTGNRRPGHHLLNLGRHELENDDLVKWTRPYLQRPEFSGEGAEGA